MMTTNTSEGDQGHLRIEHNILSFVCLQPLKLMNVPYYTSLPT